MDPPPPPAQRGAPPPHRPHSDIRRWPDRASPSPLLAARTGFRTLARSCLRCGRPPTRQPALGHRQRQPRRVAGMAGAQATAAGKFIGRDARPISGRGPSSLARPRAAPNRKPPPLHLPDAVCVVMPLSYWLRCAEDRVCREGGGPWPKQVHEATGDSSTAERPRGWEERLRGESISRRCLESGAP